MENGKMERTQRLSAFTYPFHFSFFILHSSFFIPGGWATGCLLRLAGVAYRLPAQPRRDLLARPQVIVIEMHDHGADRHALTAAGRAPLRDVLETVKKPIHPAG